MVGAKRSYSDDSVGGRGASVPVIGIGGSAGALGPLKDFFAAAPADMDAAVVVVQHLDPHHASSLREILARHTSMSVATVEHGMRAERNAVYVNPPATSVAIRQGTFWLSRTSGESPRMPIDAFFRSLAEDLKQQAVGVLFSGAGSDGAAGLRDVKEQGGLIIAQDPQEAGFDSMPRSAIAVGTVDLVLPAREMPQAIRDYFRQPYANGQASVSVAAPAADGEDQVEEILTLLAAKTPHDFHAYRRGTLVRRAERRMALRRAPSLQQYLELLKADEAEVQLLAKDLLINVTRFFREPEAWQLLADTAVPLLLKEIAQGDTVRAWVPGCSTGEEAYSLAMLLIGGIERLGLDRKVQVFATDVDEDALALARAGQYPEPIEADVPPPLLERFLVREDHHYRVRSDLSDAVVFTVHDVLHDAPFSRLDMISCRNLLIYLNPNVQEQLLELFHFALQGRGLLFLGSSETVSAKQDRFTDLSRTHNVYKCAGPVRRRHSPFPIVGGDDDRRPATGTGRAHEVLSRRALVTRATEVLLNRVVPPSVVVNERNEALHFFGDTQRYLRVPAGEATYDLTSLAHEQLRIKVRRVLRKIFYEHEAAAVETAVVRSHDDLRHIVIRAESFRWESEALALVSFLEEPAVRPGEGEYAADDKADAVNALEQELARTRSDLQRTIRELEVANEELRTANEEEISVNEELQTANEEMEASKEELQSFVEELNTLNAQLQEKAEERRRAANDLNNLLVSSDVATVFLDSHLCIKRFTPAAKRIFNFIPTDVGRPLSDLAPRFEDPNLLRHARDVFATLQPLTRDVQSQPGTWFRRRIRPYRTEDDAIEGVVITFEDITELKLAQLRAEADRHSTRIDTQRAAIAVVDADLKILSASRRFAADFGAENGHVVGRALPEVVQGAVDVAALRDRLARMAGADDHVETFEMAMTLPGKEPGTVQFVAQPILGPAGDDAPILLAMEDVTERRQSEAALREHERALRERAEELEALYDDAPVGLALLDQDLRYLRVNDALAEMNGVSAVEHIGHTVRDVVRGGLGGDIEALCRHVIETGETLRNVTLRGARKSEPGVERFWMEDVYPLREPDGAVRALGVIVRETTTEQRALRDAKLARSEAERANLAKSEFLAAASHDLRAPLQILTMLQGLLANRVTDEAVHKLVESLGATVFAMTETLDTLLDLDQLERGGIEPHVEDFDLEKLLVRLRGEFLDTARLRGLRLRLQSCPRIVQSDPRLFARILRNLISNAIKYTTTGGVLIGCRRRGETLRVEVWDSGAGIAPGQLEKIFNGDGGPEGEGAGRVRGRRGRGIGLVFARQMADLLGLKIEARSVPGRGSTFALVVPPEGHVERRLEAALATGGRVGPATVLVVEDDEHLRSALVATLDSRGYEVIGAGSRAALERATQASTPPDAAIVDQSLESERSGVEVALALREHLGRDIPAIVLCDTGSGEMQAIRDRGLQPLAKPASSEELIGRLEALLPPERRCGPTAADEPAVATVCVVEDDRDIREKLQALLEEHGYAVAAFDSAEAFLDAPRPAGPACLLLDVVLPGKTGLELHRELTSERNPLPTVIMTGRRQLSLAYEAGRSGALDVLEKPLRAETVLDAVQRALAGALQPAEAHGGKADERSALQDLYDALTRREQEVMGLIVQGLHNKEIAYRLGISERTVEGHRGRVMSKMRVRSVADLVRIAGGLGIDPSVATSPA